MYTKEYFIKKFEAIPEEKWTKSTLCDGQGAYCALGHCGMDHLHRGSITDEARALMKLFGADFDDEDDGQLFRSVYKYNDWEGEFGYLGETPKKRIIAALRSLKG